MEIPNYQLLRTLGKGGMATVYLALQESLQREVALKVMDPALVEQQGFVERFLKEGRLIARLTHPNIVTVHDVAGAEGVFYLAMECLPEGDLPQAIRGGMAPERALRVLEQMAGALAVAHRHGIIHRDIKPANILFRDADTAVLTDFGIAKMRVADTHLTQIGWVVGTPQYMSPEQARGQDLDGRSDLYSLGIVLFEMLTGRRPFGNADADTGVGSTRTALQLPATVAQYQPLIDGLLAFDVEQRFGDAHALIDAITALRAGRLPTLPGNEDQTEIAETATVIATAGQAAVPATVSSTSTSASKEGTRSARWLWGLPVVALLVGGLWALLWKNRPPENVSPSSPMVTLPVVEPGRVKTSRPPLPPATQAKIERLLKAAEVHLLVGQVTGPPGNNAADAYRLILKLDPGNPVAAEGLKKITAGSVESL